MNRVFVVADTHFGHKKIIEFEGVARPFNTIEEHDRELVLRWNAIVKKHDTVWHLGDVFFGQDTHAILGQLNGVKHLVLGNHDGYPHEIYSKYFNKIQGAKKYGDALLTHVPIHPSQLEYRFKQNIHGHMHSLKLDDPRYKCVSLEHTSLAPVLINEILT